ncbi:MAG TPA: flavin reductase family protein [Planctomycetes bacterium]|nr:flavin reductase family protein [Planctomycetota bacterium]
MSDRPEPTPIGKALGRLPTGLYIVATRAQAPDSPAVGFVGSFVMQQGLASPVVSVAVGKDRAHLDAIRAAGAFSISILDSASSGSMGAFFKKYEPGSGPFDDLETLETPRGLPALAGALAWLECEVTGEHELEDHIVVFGKVLAGAQLHDGDPAIHLRKDGLGY